MGGSSLGKGGTQRTEIAHALRGTRITHPCRSSPGRMEPRLVLRDEQKDCRPSASREDPLETTTLGL